MKIAFFRALQLGDLLCAVPALRAMRMAWPDAQVTLVGLPWAKGFAERYRRYVDHFVEFPGFPGMPETACDAARFPGFLADMRARGFDLAIQAHGSGELTNPLVALFGARRCAGFHGAGAFRPDADGFLPWRAEEHEVLRWIRLVEHLGASPRGTHLEFPLDAADRRQARQLAPDGAYAVVHPGSQLPSRRWLPERFAAVADGLAARGLQIVLTGTAGEGALVTAVRRAMRSPALDLAGKTTLGGLGGLIAGARVLVANDTGVSHIAAALGTPSVIVACGSDTRRWAPLERSRHRVLAHDTPCRPCAWRECPIGHPCASGLSVDDVNEAINDLREDPRCAA